jgi:hypothetical protein
MIVKIQVPLESNMPNPPILIYNEDRTFEATNDDPAFADWARGVGKPKFFANMSVVISTDQQVTFLINNMVEDPGW